MQNHPHECEQALGSIDIQDSPGRDYVIHDAPPDLRLEGGAIVKRYEWTEAQWVRSEGLLLGKPGTPGRTGADTRVCVNAVLWGLRSGVRWRDLPPQRHPIRPNSTILPRLQTPRCCSRVEAMNVDSA